MKSWIPLFKSFLNSPTPDFDTSFYFQQQNNPSRSAFLSLLLTPIPSSSSQDPLIYFQTLPPYIQSRILSFISIERSLFSSYNIHSLCLHILNSSNSYVQHTGFWVHRAACNLLNIVTKDELHNLPDFIQSSIPWLPISYQELTNTTNFNPAKFPNESKKDEVSFMEQEVVDSCSPISSSLDASTREKATALKSKISNAASSSEAMHIANEIRKLCLGSHHELKLLNVIEACEAEDEILAVILTNLTQEGSLVLSSDWPAHVLSAVILPKFIKLNSPVSRVLLSSTISFCKLFPVAAVEALLFPLLLCKEGINAVLCDVLTRIMKECLHRAHVSAFFQKLLCSEKKSNELVWTESTFSLLQNVLNLEVYMTPDSVDEIVCVVAEQAEKLSKSLKFGNFFLCFVTKCSRAVRVYKDVLEEAVEKIDTFVSKSILLKLGSQQV